MSYTFNPEEEYSTAFIGCSGWTTKKRFYVVTAEALAAYYAKQVECSESQPAP